MSTASSLGLLTANMETMLFLAAIFTEKRMRPIPGTIRIVIREVLFSEPSVMRPGRTPFAVPSRKTPQL